jgi:hypothetical protein
MSRKVFNSPFFNFLESEKLMYDIVISKKHIVDIYLSNHFSGYDKEYVGRYIDIMLDECFGWINRNIEHKIFLSLKSIIECYQDDNEVTKRKQDFYQKICDTISHESIHIWILENCGLKATHQYDNIAFEKIESFGYYG